MLWLSFRIHFCVHSMCFYIMDNCMCFQSLLVFTNNLFAELLNSNKFSSNIRFYTYILSNLTSWAIYEYKQSFLLEANNAAIVLQNTFPCTSDLFSDHGLLHMLPIFASELSFSVISLSNCYILLFSLNIRFSRYI